MLGLLLTMFASKELTATPVEVQFIGCSSSPKSPPFVFWALPTMFGVLLGVLGSWLFELWFEKQTHKDRSEKCACGYKPRLKRCRSQPSLINGRRQEDRQQYNPQRVIINDRRSRLRSQRPLQTPIVEGSSRSKPRHSLLSTSFAVAIVIMWCILLWKQRDDLRVLRADPVYQPQEVVDYSYEPQQIAVDYPTQPVHRPQQHNKFTDQSLASNPCLSF